ncbi:hypothetical protein [Chondrinema litorale]|uniref:hypothetical protein n=1 Tax=Chondrinema litorale TaxID=2994555 RepID=UPI0025429400|nr:hypothetical protein [Chondrinema litorale]UZR97414.1 hypothetical protein OQ292_26765 [Chondrinema litorale]
MVTIFIKKQPESTDLVLFDTEGNIGEDINFKTPVIRGQKVVWKLATDSGIDAIVGISKKDNSQNIFSTYPTENSSNSSWEGMVSEAATGSEGYNISYKINGIEHIFDPELEVKDDGDDDGGE